MGDSILNYDYIKTYITTNKGEKVPYRWSHGATDMHLGDGMIIYSLIYFHKFKSLVCLGSGGGFVPRIMSQASYVVDACTGFNGEVDWEKEDSVFRRHFHPKFIKETTESAYYNFFVKQDIKIDYLHIDADHTFEGVKKDFELYSQRMNRGGIITVHDTDKSYVDNFTEIQNHEGDDLSGPSEFVKTIDKRKFEVFNLFNHGIMPDFPSSTGLTMVRKK